MAIQKALPAFSSDTEKTMDFSAIPVADIFNQIVVPKLRSLASMLQGDLGGLNEAAQRRAARSAMDAPSPAEMFATPEEEPFAGSPDMPDESSLDDGGEEDYNQPVSQGSSDGIKLSNYGYSSDKTPDYNSNVLKVGHSNNQLVSGKSAALSKSLATRLGLKTGDEFEAVAADGKVYRRRYDDTVPSTYKGKALPETVDLYDTNGSNNFTGRIVDIRVINQ